MTRYWFHLKRLKDSPQTSVIKKNPGDNNGVTPLHEAARKGHFKICQLLIDTIVEKNPQTSEGDSVLQFATFNGHSDICKLIIDSKQNTNILLE